MQQPKKEKFDPNKPYEVVEDNNGGNGSKPKFDPSKPFDVVKKKDNSASTSTTPEQNSELAPKTGSVDSVDYEYKPIIDPSGKEVYTQDASGKLVPATEKVKKGYASSTEYRTAEREDLKKRAEKSIQPSVNLQQYQQATSLTEDEVNQADKEIDDELNERGFFNGMTTGFKKGANFLSDILTTVGTFGTETKGPNFEVTPFAKEQKKAKEELIKKYNGDGSKITEEELKTATKEIVLDKRIEGIKIDKNNTFLSTLSLEDKKALELERVEQYKTISDREKYLYTEAALLTNEVEKLAKDYTVTKAIIENNNKQNIQTSRALIEHGLNLESKLNESVATARALEDKISDTENKLGSAEEEIDFLKRNYSTKDKFVQNMKLGAGDFWMNISNDLPMLVSKIDDAIFEPFRPGSSEGVMSDAEKIEMVDAAIDWEVAKEKTRSKLKKDVTFENLNLSNFGQFFFQELGTQVPIFAQIALPGGIVSIGMTSAGDKFAEMEMESNQIDFKANGKKYSGYEKEDGTIISTDGFKFSTDDVTITSLRKSDYSPGQMIATAVGFGTAESVLGAMPTKGIMNRSVQAMERTGQRQLFRESGKEYLKNKLTGVVKDGSLEAVSEGLTQVTQNLLDKTILGKKDVGLFDNVGHASFSGGMLGGAISAMPTVAGLIMRPFSENKQSKVVRNNLEMIFELQEELNNSSISESSRNVINEKIATLETQNQDLLKSIAKDASKISEEVFNAVVVVNKKQELLKIQAAEIKADTSLNSEIKAELIKDLESEFNILETKRSKLISKDATVLETLPDSEVMRLKNKASKELIAQAKAEGKTEFNFDDAQISKKAIEIYNESKKPVVEAKAEEQAVDSEVDTKKETESIRTDINVGDKFNYSFGIARDGVVEVIRDFGDGNVETRYADGTTKKESKANLIAYLNDSNYDTYTEINQSNNSQISEVNDNAVVEENNDVNPKPSQIRIYEYNGKKYQITDNGGVLVYDNGKESMIPLDLVEEIEKKGNYLGAINNQELINEATPSQNITPDANVQPGIGNMGEVAVEPTAEVVEEGGVQPANEAGAVEGKQDLESIGTQNYKQKKSQVEGRKREITIADGSKVKGQYKVVSADDILASHNEESFGKTQGYPINERGETINDRDYERDKNAQAEVSKIAQDYDGRAIQQTPVVTTEGIVVDGNNRVMSRKLAAKKGTDGKYKEALMQEADMYGINPEDITAIKNPIIVFEAEGSMPYTTETLAKFNKQDKKEKSSSGKAVEFSKTLSDRAKRQIAEVYDAAERPSDVTADPKAVKQLRDILLNNNIIQSNEIPRYFDVDKGVMTKEGVSLMENIALGSVFNEQTINTLSLQGMGDIRNKILQSLVGLINNSSLDEKYRLGSEMAKAIEVIYQLKTTKQSIEEYLDQPDIFGEKFTPNIDEYAVILAVSDAGFKKWLQNYNDNVGQPDIFKAEGDGITTKRDKSNETITDRKKQIPSNLRSDAKRNANENGQQNGIVEGEVENKPSDSKDAQNEEVKPPTKDSTADDLLKWIDKARKDLDDFDKGTLSSVVGMPVQLAKLALDAMRLAVIAGKKFSEVVKAGMDVVKNSQWYQNLTTTEQKEVEDNFIQSLSDNNRQAANAINRAFSNSLTEDEAFDKFNESADNSEKQLENKQPAKEVFRKMYRGFVKRFTDRQYLAKRLLDQSGLTKTKNLIINSHGASGKAKMVFEEAYNTIYRNLNRKDRKMLDRVIQAKRFIAIDTNREARGLDPVSHPDFIDKVVSQKYLDKLKKTVGVDKFNDIETRANEYFKVYRKLLKDMYDNGLITKESYDSISDLDYQPRVFLQFVTDFNGDLETGNKNVKDTGGLSQDQIKTMSEGDASALVLNSEWLLMNSLLARTKAMSNNNINRRFMDEEFQKAKKRFDAIDPKNFKNKEEKRFYNYFKELNSKVIDNPIVGYTDSGNPKYSYDKAPANFSKMYYYKDGVQHQFFLENELHESWNDNIDGVFSNSDLKEFISYASGSAMVKAIATGNNPAFPIVNTPRDFFFTIAFSDQYSGNVLKSLGQITKDVVKAIIAIRKDGDSVKKYFEYGGAMDFLSTQGQLKKESLLGKAIDKAISPDSKDKTKKFFDKATLRKISTYSELMFRIGIFERSIANQLKSLKFKTISDVTDKQQLDDIYNQAVANARGILDFNQGGVITKDLEAFIPYINVAFQGGRVAANSFEKDPVGTTSRILQISTMASTVPIGLSLMMIGLNKDDDDERTAYQIYVDAIDGVSPYQKSRYMTIFTGEKNEEGQYRYVKVAKSQELTPFMSITDNIYQNMIRSLAGREKRSASLIASDAAFVFRSNVLPVDVTSPSGFITRNPVIKATLTYATGYDFFREQPLDFKLENRPSPSEGMNRKDVEDFYKKLGTEYGLSPIRSKAFVESLITSPNTNPFVGVLYGGAEAVSSDKDFKQIGKKLMEDIYKSTGKRIVGYTSDFNRQLETNKQLEEKIEQVKLKDAIQKKEFKDLADGFINKDITRTELKEKLKDLDPDDQKRFMNKLKDRAKMKDVSGTILDIKYERSPEIKALMIVHHYGNIFDGTPESKDVYIEMNKVGGILTPAVKKELQKLVLELNKKPSK